MQIIALIKQRDMHARFFPSTYLYDIVFAPPVFMGHKEIVYDIEVWRVEYHDSNSIS
jgi:hypothetical protein